MSETYKTLREMSEETLIETLDKVTQPWQPDPAHYLAEIARRDQQRQTLTMLRYTCWITVMTVVMTVATILNLWKSN